VQKVLQNLLRERVSIRDAGTIVESLGEAAAVTRNPVLLTEFIRQAIRRHLVKPHLNPNGDLAAWLVDPAIEQAIESSVEHAETMSHMNMAPQKIRDIVDRFTRAIGPPDTTATVLVGSGARYFLRQITESCLPVISVLSHSEILPGVKIIAVGTVR